MSTSPTVRGTTHPRFDEILTPAALEFLGALDEKFARRRAELVQGRRVRSRRISSGENLAFAESTSAIREGDWKVAPDAPGLFDRRVELISPIGRRIAQHALNSGASTWIADFEDSTAPTWFNVIDGQIVLRDVIVQDLPHAKNAPTLIMRPRAWHSSEEHILAADGRPMSASLVDFGLFFFHNVRALTSAGIGPYFYLPKIESADEARLWNDIFNWAQDELDIPRGTIRATVLIETLPAAFEMEEILYELRDHAAGLNAGRWDYIFSYVRTFAARGSEYVLPDRQLITMTVPFMRAFTELLVATAHKRGTFAIAAPVALNPNAQDEERRHRALNVTVAEKEREAEEGFDGSWVAHPALVEPVKQAFANVLGDKLDQRDVCPALKRDASKLVDLNGSVQRATLTGLRSNIHAALSYLAAWVQGRGAVAIGEGIEDAATTEISRAQLWQWTRHSTQLAEGPEVTPALVERLIDEEVARLSRGADAQQVEALRAAREILEQCALSEELPGFFTNYAYARFLVDDDLRVGTGLVKENLRHSEDILSA